MAQRYESKDVVCPFYKYEKGGRLFCEGLYKSGSVCQTFGGNESKMAHKLRFCMDFEGYPTCPLYIAINGKYEVKDE